MIVVRVELHSAQTKEVTEIARMEIVNVSRTLSRLQSYEGRSFKGRSTAALDRREVTRKGSVDKYPREEHHVWHLVEAMLRAMGYKW